jgi:hypothetical protein
MATKARSSGQAFVQPGVMRDAGRQTTLQLNFAVALLGFLSELLLAPAEWSPGVSKETMWSLLKAIHHTLHNNDL